MFMSVFILHDQIGKCYCIVNILDEIKLVLTFVCVKVTKGVLGQEH